MLAILTAAACTASSGETEGGTTVDSVETTTSSVHVDDSVPLGDLPEGFSTVTAQITKADGEVCEVCLWLADSADERGRGLMGVTDLGEPVGMAFSFDEAVNGNFYMFQTPTPLSISWFAADGSIVGVADMAPCLDVASSDCPRYSPDSNYTLVIETFEGGMSELGIGPGSSVFLVPGSESQSCALAG